MTEYAPQAIKDCFSRIQASIPEAILAGIIGDSAHTYGYHRGRNYVSGSDYSNQLAADKSGDGEAASALDLSWSSANRQYEVSKRIMAAKADQRLTRCCRSFFGSTDGINVCGWDFQGGYACSSDDSHLWHVHISFLRSYANDKAALAAVADVICGTGGSTPQPEPDLSEVEPMIVIWNRTSGYAMLSPEDGTRRQLSGPQKNAIADYLSPKAGGAIKVIEINDTAWSQIPQRSVDT